MIELDGNIVTYHKQVKSVIGQCLELPCTTALLQADKQGCPSINGNISRKGNNVEQKALRSVNMQML